MISSVKEFFDEIGKSKYKHELSENLIEQVNKAYSNNGLEGVNLLLAKIREKYMGNEENEN